MAGFPELAALETLRKALAERSDRHRRSLTIDYHKVRVSTGWIRQAYALGRATAPLLLWVAPLGALLLRHRRVVPKSTIGKLILGWHTARSLTSLWQILSGNESGSERSAGDSARSLRHSRSR